MHNNIRKLIRQRKRIHKQAKQKVNDENSWFLFRKKKNEVIAAVRKAKKSYLEKLTQKTSDNYDSTKTWWKVTKTFLNSKKQSEIPPLFYNNSFYENPQEKVEIFNDFFASQFDLNDSGTSIPDLIGDPNQNIIENIELSENEVIDILKSLDTSKSSGPDFISPKMLKIGASELANPLCKLFNTSLNCCKFPSSWKKANITPVYKKGNKDSVSNYRPISLLSCVGKVMERCVYKHLHNFMRDNDIITKFQSGFTKGDSTTNQLTNTYNTFASALDNGKEIRVVFFDISKAFDRVWHKGLIYKLKKIGIKSNIILWLTDYLCDRKQRVVLDGKVSDWRDVKAGVPQGPILGPLLFLVFINDITESIGTNIRLFADDTSLYLVIENPVNDAVRLQLDLQNISTWAKQWLVYFHPDKTVSMLISKRIIRPIHPPLIMNGAPLTEVTSHKHLGIYISNDGSWHDHIKYIMEKGVETVAITKKSKILSRLKIPKKIYFSFIRPILEYGDFI